jgi:acetoin utilization deacetylase AcuC-like enzyme
VERILARIEEVGLGEVLSPAEHDLEPILRLHDPDYVEFLQTAWERWKRAGYEGEAIPEIWPARGQLHRPPEGIAGRLGYYALAAETSITEGTWVAARAAADVALTAADLLAEGDPAAFALCRPPGHHAARDLFGGYCFLNNTALAAQSLLDDGAERVAVLDVDFHHGNGTQSIFYERGDVLFLSLHGDPARAFPYYTGYADETGAGPGEGTTANYPLPEGTDYERWSRALADAARRLHAYAPEALVVSLGVDTFRGDPISSFTLDTPDYLRMGAAIALLRLPTLFVMEGGYAVEEIGVNTVNVLTGFEGAGTQRS